MKSDAMSSRSRPILAAALLVVVTHRRGAKSFFWIPVSYLP
jgi:hypothetical protein